MQKQLSMRDKVFIAQEIMEQAPPAFKIELEVKHYFSHGIYARELYVPKGVTLVGKIHKFTQFHLITKGDISFLVDDEIKRFKAPSNIVSAAGSKRIAHAHEDTIWIMIHRTDETDIDKIEKHFIAQTEKEYLDFCNEQLKLPLETI